MLDFDATKRRNACKNKIKAEWQKDTIAKITVFYRQNYFYRSK
jgi:hypothetical protein